MAQFIVIYANRNDVPALGETGPGTVYRGDHPDEATAVRAAADAIGLGSADRLWAVPAGDLTRYVNTTATSRTVATG